MIRIDIDAATAAYHALEQVDGHYDPDDAYDVVNVTLEAQIAEARKTKDTFRRWWLNYMCHERKRQAEEQEEIDRERSGE